MRHQPIHYLPFTINCLCPSLKITPQLQIIRDIAGRRKVEVHLVGGFCAIIVSETPGRTLILPWKRMPWTSRAFLPAALKGVRRAGPGTRLRPRGQKSDGKIWTFDFSDFRARSFRQDLTLRDFTINTLSMDLAKLNGSTRLPALSKTRLPALSKTKLPALSKKLPALSKTRLEDVLADGKKGLRDLRAKRIRRVAVKAFRDDPLRLLRAFSLSAILDFKIEPQTLAQIRREKNLLRGVSYERIRDEIFKILETERAAAALKAMDKAGLLDKVIPQVKVMYHCAQKGTYHHLDVWPHSLEVVAQFDNVVREMGNNPDVVEYLNESLGGNRTRRALLKLIALLHDIGKPETRKEAGRGKLTFYGHERVGKNIVTYIARMLKLSTGERHALEDMVLWHLRPGYLSNFQKPSEKSIYRYLRDTKKRRPGFYCCPWRINAQRVAP